VLHRRRPGVVGLLVVLRPERFEHELGGLQPERDLEFGRDELGHTVDRRTSVQVGWAESFVLGEPVFPNDS
jgi:hypothetical protein